MKRPAFSQFRALFFSLTVVSGVFGTSAAQTPEYTLLLPVFTDQGTWLGDYDIARSIVGAGGDLREGGHTPDVIARLGVREYAPTAVSDGAGGMYLVYTIEHVDSVNRGDTDILIRRIDSLGRDVWNDSVLGSVRFIADSPHLERNPLVRRLPNGILIVYEVEYSSGDFAGDVDIAAQILPLDGSDTDSYSLWVANSDRREGRPRLAGTSDGTVVVFERSTGDDREKTGDIAAVRISNDGTKGWPGGEPEIPVAASSHGESNFSLTESPAGGVYVAYELLYTSGEKGGDIDIVAQHLDRNGRRKWIDPARPPMVASSRKALERKPTLVGDSSGILVAFEIVSVEESGNVHSNSVIGLQRLDTAGQAIWNRGSRSTLIPAKHRIGVEPHLVPDNLGGTYVIFDGFDTITGDRDVFAQHADREGSLSWNREFAIPVFYGPMPETLIDALPDNAGGVVVFAAQVPIYRTESSEPRDTGIIAHRLDRFGEHTWGIGENNLLVTTAILGEHPPVVLDLGD